MKKIVILIAAIVMAAVSCNKENAPESGDNTSVTGKLTATIVQTKVSYTETSSLNLQPAWEVGDEIIGFDDNGNTYTLSVASVSAQTATLEGILPDGDFHLIYKSGAKTSDITNKTLAIDYTNQSGDKTMPAVMLADGTVEDGACEFAFVNAGAIIGISAVKGVPSGSTISKITVEGENLSAATVALSGSALTLTATTAANDAISTATLSGITTTDANGTLSSPVFVAVPAGAKIAKVIAGNYTYALSSVKTVEAGQYLYIKTQTFKGIPEGALSGLFSVSDTKKVRFSKGNLRYTLANSTWSFYDNQFESGPLNYSDGHDAEISLFTWGYNATQSIIPDGVLADNVSRLSGNLSQSEDWGSKIGDGNTWRTLTISEWAYLFSYDGSSNPPFADTRDNFDNDNRRGKCKFNVTVCGKEKCTVIAPDNFTGAIADSYDASAWSAAESEGLVCFPISGFREEDVVISADLCGYYWSSTTESDNAKAMRASMAPSGLSFASFASSFRAYGHAVRLVTDAN